MTAAALLTNTAVEHFVDLADEALRWLAERQSANVRWRLERFRRRHERGGAGGRWELAVPADELQDRGLSYWRHLAEQRLGAFADALWDTLALQVTVPTRLTVREVAAATAQLRESWRAELVADVTTRTATAAVAELELEQGRIRAGADVDLLGELAASIDRAVAGVDLVPAIRGAEASLRTWAESRTGD